MFKKGNTLLTIAVIAVVLFIIIFLNERNKKTVPALESSFGDDDNKLKLEELEVEVMEDLPGLMDLQYKIATQGKRSVFPMVIEKITRGPIELPNRRSLLNKDAKYKYRDIMTGEKITIVSLQYLSYTVDHTAFNDSFLVTDDDLLIAVSQAKEHFKLITK